MPPIPSPALTSSIVDVTKYGLLPGFDFSLADANSRAWDALVSASVSEPGTSVTTTAKTLHFPGTPLSTYMFRFPAFIELDNVRVTGDGADYTRVSNLTGSPVFAVGLKRNPNGNTLTNANFVDLTTIIPTAPHGPDGKAYGLALNANTLLTGPGTSGAVGPNAGYWPGCKQLSISFSCNFGADTWQGPICGVSKRGQPLPFVFHRQSNGIAFYCAFADGARRSIVIITPQASGRLDLDLEIDITNATVAAWVNSVQVPISGSLGTDFVPGNTLAFIDNPYVSFMIGAEGNGLAASDSFGGCTDINGNYLSVGYPDLTLYGIVLRNKLHYQHLGVRRPRLRIDGTVENDYTRLYSGQDAFFYYWPAFAAADVIQFRCVPFQTEAGIASQYMLWLDPAAADIYAGTTKNNSIKDMSITSGGNRSMSIMLGHALHAEFGGLTIDNGWNAIGCIPIGANYPIYIHDCNLGGYDAGIFGYYGIYWLDRVYITRGFRVSLRFAGSKVTLRTVQVAGNGTPDWICWMGADEGGGNYEINDLSSDYEDGISPKKGHLYIEGHTNNPGGYTYLTINNLSGNIPNGAAGVSLVDNGPASGNHLGGVFLYRNLNLSNGGNGSPIIASQSSYWRVVGDQETKQAPWLTGGAVSVITPQIAPLPPPP